MHFTSLVFIVFLAIVFALYWLARTPRWQNLILVVASYVFYGWWDYRFCALILISSLVDFAIANRIAATDQTTKRRLLLALSLVSNLGLLAVFKYFGFFADNLQVIANSFGWTMRPITLNVILPVGISFYTFQTLSYTIDVYRGQLKPAKSLINYLAFVSFFPQLVAGPIERGTRLLPQFQKRRAFDSITAADGCRWILWGFFKKLAIADPLAVQVDRFYGDWESATGAELTLATVFFAFQIYCDFSSYSDIAIGTARLFSIRLMRNFAYPYFSRSVGEFWGRWHISLSTWFRDYVYIPLGGNRGGPVRRSVNILVTFLLSGLWHGAAWTFIAWGGIHGAAVTGQKSMSDASAKLTGSRGTRASDEVVGGAEFFPRPMTLLKIWLTFTLVCCGWVFFRAESMPAAWAILGAMFGSIVQLGDWSLLLEMIGDDKEMVKALTILFAFVLVEWARRRHECPLASGRRIFLPVRWAVYTLLIWGTLDLVATVDQQPFVYFAF